MFVKARPQSASPLLQHRVADCLTGSGGLQTQLPVGYCLDASQDSGLWSEQIS